MAANAKPRDVVVPCVQGHRVRLGRGRRFWRSARCPVCRSPVDPTRRHRLVRWTANLRRPASRSTIDRGLWWGTAVYSGVTLLALAMIWLWSDLWWPATTLLFGPRWVLLVPLTGLVPLALRRDRAITVPLAVIGVLLLGPVVGLRTGWRDLLRSEDPAGDLRVASFNVAGGESITTGPTALMLEWDTDLAAFQECRGAFREAVSFLSDFHTDVRNDLCLVSRFEILEVRQMERESFRLAGGSALVMTYVLDIEGEEVYLTNLHLETPRAGLTLMREGDLERGIDRMSEKSALRAIELRAARGWVGQFVGPSLVVGDFNTPAESTIYREVWSDWQNSFSLLGHGLGGTRLNGWIRARIDHILVDDDWIVIGAELGRDVGSDHRPILATVRRD